MNHRRALRASTDTSLVFFAVMTAGMVLWTTDEVLQWDLFPDWIGRYAQLIVIVLAILAVSAVVTSVICSLAVLAESAAQRSGLPDVAPSPRSRRLGRPGPEGAQGPPRRVPRHEEAERLGHPEAGRQGRQHRDALGAALT
jgi:hypothetical protein